MMNGIEASAMEADAMLGRWRMLVEDWALTWGERRALLPAGEGFLSSMPEDSETRMRILIEIDRHVPSRDGGGLADWLREPAEELGWCSPLEAMSRTLPDLRRFRHYLEQGLGS